MNAFTVVLAILTCLAGAAIGLAVAAWFAGRRIRPLESEADDAVSRLSEVRQQLAASEAENRLLKEHNHRLTRQGDESGSVLKALAPVAEKLGHVQQQVSVLERDRVEQFGHLTEALRLSRRTDEQLLTTTQSLSAALRNNAVRGTWGEAQLRRVVETCGMLNRVDFAEQVTLTEHDGGRPDMVINLPGSKCMVLDAKVPLSAYLRAGEASVNGTEKEAREQAALLKEHAKAVRAHVDALAARKYWEGAPNSPELVVCFIPAESFLSAALQADPGLLDYAFTKNVALASPVTLLAVLKAVAFSWRQDVLTENAKELFDLSTQLYNRLGTMGDHVSKLGNSLKSSVEKYNAFVGTLESRVMPTARKINELDPTGLRETVAPAALETTPRLLSSPELIDGAS
ncbi:DNA recombination protein RmuC [Arthrobacter roseus]|uniref:DNA recombination protein RmuC n=1 Tax=Arthrobacter roseus TaxID=136274 RepID=UPI0019632E24|nr:DNA recombination protein RmuC [Arthrobacter roseus]MBM7849219.1 DNA recombination protein RmuC [Arthrobacter roseus]